MKTPRSKTATEMLLMAREGGADQAARLLDLVGEELHSIAEAYLRRERAEHTLQPTALVHEAYLRLVDSTAIHGGDRGRFMCIAARAMRRVLVDFARARETQRRGGGLWQRVTLYPESLAEESQDVDLLDLHELLERFSLIDERASQVVELRFFAGLSLDETAEVLGISERTVENDWYMARAWLMRELSGDSSS